MMVTRQTLKKLSSFYEQVNLEKEYSLIYLLFFKVKIYIKKYKIMVFEQKFEQLTTELGIPFTNSTYRVDVYMFINIFLIFDIYFGFTIFICDLRRFK